MATLLYTIVRPASSSPRPSVFAYCPPEREALRWIQKHIGAFGGDPSMVTMCVVVSFLHLNLSSNVAYSWGASAGGMSVGSHLVANGGDNEGLFRAAVMAGGSLLPTGDTSKQQSCFDTVAAHVGCGAAEDKLQCLRGVPGGNLTAATALTPSFLGYKVCCEHLSLCVGHGLTRRRYCHQGMGALQWFPHADGTLLREPVRDAALAGKIANVPFIVG